LEATTFLLLLGANMRRNALKYAPITMNWGFGLGQRKEVSKGSRILYQGLCLSSLLLIMTRMMSHIHFSNNKIIEHCIDGFVWLFIIFIEYESAKV